MDGFEWSCCKLSHFGNDPQPYKPLHFLKNPTSSKTLKRLKTFEYPRNPRKYPCKNLLKCAQKQALKSSSPQRTEIARRSEISFTTNEPCLLAIFSITARLWHSKRSEIGKLASRYVIGPDTFLPFFFTVQSTTKL